MVLCNLAVEYNVAAFSGLSFAIHWQGGCTEASTMSNSANVKLLTPAAMVENSAEKIDECPLVGVVEYCLRTVGTTKSVCYTE